MVAPKTETFLLYPNYKNNYKNYKNQAFSLEIKERETPESFEQLLTSYLGEYRFQLPLYQYSYYFSPEQGLVDPNTNESMIDKGIRSIQRRFEEGKLTKREEAELRGLEKIKLMLEEKRQENPDEFIGTSFFWISPPGERNDGYGDYAFVFYGVVDNFDFNGWHITMNARRIDQGRDYERLRLLAQMLFGQEVNYESDISFLENPFLMSADIVNPEAIVAEIFGSIDKEVVQIFNKALGENGQLRPLLEQAVKAYLRGNISEFIRLFTALENLSDDFRRASYDLSQLIEQVPTFVFDPRIIDFYSSYAPSSISGSCGSTSVRETSNFLQELHIPSLRDLKDLLFNNRYEDYECPQCHGKIKGELKGKPETWHKNCPHCGYRLGCAD